MPSFTADMISEIRKRATAVCVDLSLSLMEEVQGTGDALLSREQRIERFVADAHSGALDVLEGIRPDLHRQLVRQYLRDLEASALTGTQPMGDWFGLQDLPPDEVETERKFAVNPSLIQLPQPWVLVQGYRAPGESLRLIPARGTAFARLKHPGTLSVSREKTSREQPYEDAVQFMLEHVPKVAVKERHLVRDQSGRAWLIDHVLNGDGMWWAETELQNAPPLSYMPPWIMADVSDNPKGYTYSHATAMTTHDKRRAIEYARARGSTADYLPSEDPAFQWMT